MIVDVMALLSESDTDDYLARGWVFRGSHMTIDGGMVNMRIDFPTNVPNPVRLDQSKLNLIPRLQMFLAVPGAGLNMYSGFIAGPVMLDTGRVDTTIGTLMALRDFLTSQEIAPVDTKHSTSLYCLAYGSAKAVQAYAAANFELLSTLAREPGSLIVDVSNHTLLTATPGLGGQLLEILAASYTHLMRYKP